jgi:hypothetical protein
VAAGQACKLGRWFSRCGQPAIETCQYCGRPFCGAHAHYVGGTDAVCASDKCRRKHEDLAAHEAYKLAVTRRNMLELCGEEECRGDPSLTCSLCEGRFCSEHLHVREWGFRDAQASYKRMVSISAHCWGRRRIWR